MSSGSPFTKIVGLVR